MERYGLWSELDKTRLHITQVGESLTFWFRRASTNAIVSLNRTRIWRILPAATKVSAGIVLRDACAALALTIRITTRADRIRNVEHTVAFLVGRALCFVTIEALARFRHWRG